MKHRLIKRLSLALALVVLTTVVASCGWFDEKIYSGGDQYICVLNTRTGTVTKEIPPGEKKGYTLGDDEVDYAVPTSNRFYNISVDRTVADDGAPAWIQTRSAGIKDIRTNVQARFVFNQANICKFVLKHVKRNDSDNNQDFEFNKRPDDNGYDKETGKANKKSNSEWVGWLNENDAGAMSKTLIPITRAYTWQGLEFNYPVNADENGVVPMDTTAGELIWRQIEIDWGKSFTKELNAKSGGDFFCGISYDPAKPDKCPPIEMDVQKIWNVDRDPVLALQKLDNDRDARDIAEQSAAIASDTLTQKTASLDANQKLADIEIAEANKQADVEQAKAAVAFEKAKSDAALDPNTLKCIVLAQQAGGCPEVETAKRNADGNTTVNVGPSGG